ncbi:MAG: hypothetical protein J5I92_00005, partial [Thiogranum sp.]|nr:hypothetical protein [Thiogranum sp.]
MRSLREAGSIMPPVRIIQQTDRLEAVNRFIRAFEAFPQINVGVFPLSEKRLTCKYESISFAGSAGNHLKVDLVCTKVDCCSIEVKGNKNGYAGRKKLWQLDSPFHCSVIGTCLSLEELRDLCRKMRISVQAPLTD